MYDELVKRVRQVAEEVCEDYDVDPYNAEQRFFVIEEAADAIEELQGWNNTFSDSVAMLMRQIAELSKRVPKTPHGRLIDADALRAKQQEDADLFQGSTAYCDKCRRDEAMNAVANIVNAPTVIEAEEGETCILM